MAEIAFELGAELVGAKEVIEADRAASHLVLVGRADALAGVPILSPALRAASRARSSAT